MHGNVASQKKLNDSMTKIRIHRILVQFRALSWAARELKVNKGTLHRFLVGDRPAGAHSELKERAEQLAKRLAATNGRDKR